LFLPPRGPVLMRGAASTTWFISALGIAQICSWGTLFYGFPLIAEAMRLDLGWSKPLLYGAATVGLVLAAAAAYPVGAAIDRGQGRLIMPLASVIAGLLLLAWSQVNGVVPFYIILALVGCMQAATLYDPAFAVITRRVGHERARSAITTLTLWAGFASTVFIPIIQLLIEAQGWRGALVVMAGVNIVICGGIYAAVIDPAKDHASPRSDLDAPPPLLGRAAVASAMKRPAYWGLMVAWVSYAAAFSALTYHLYPLLLERGLTAGGVVAVMAVIGPAQVAGRIFIMAFAPNAPIRRLGSMIMIVFPISVIGFALAPPGVLVIALIAAFYGAANGMVTIVRGLAVPEMVSREAYGAINGSLIAPANLMQAAAPLVAALVWEASGSYSAVLVFIFAGSLSLCAGFWYAAAKSFR
jgi:MFS family permease